MKVVRVNIQEMKILKSELCGFIRWKKIIFNFDLQKVTIKLLSISIFLKNKEHNDENKNKKFVFGS